MKNTPRLVTVWECGVDDALPGRRSLSRTVPAAVPSVFHSSVPVAGVDAGNHSSPPTEAQMPGAEPMAPGARSVIIAVPAVVPSLRYSSYPVSGVQLVKYNAPAWAVSEPTSQGPP